MTGVIQSIAPGCTIRARSLPPHPDLLVGGAFESEIVKQLDEALTLHPDLINLSAGCPTRQNKPARAFENWWADVSTRQPPIKLPLIVAAAGNNSSPWGFWPASFDWALGVGLGRQGRPRLGLLQLGRLRRCLRPGPGPGQRVPQRHRRVPREPRSGRPARVQEMASALERNLVLGASGHRHDRRGDERSRGADGARGPGHGARSSPPGAGAARSYGARRARRTAGGLAAAGSVLRAGHQHDPRRTPGALPRPARRTAPARSVRRWRRRPTCSTGTRSASPPRPDSTTTSSTLASSTCPKTRSPSTSISSESPSLSKCSVRHVEGTADCGVGQLEGVVGQRQQLLVDGAPRERGPGRLASMIWYSAATCPMARASSSMSPSSSVEEDIESTSSSMGLRRRRQPRSPESCAAGPARVPGWARYCPRGCRAGHRCRRRRAAGPRAAGAAARDAPRARAWPPATPATRSSTSAAPGSGPRRGRTFCHRVDRRLDPGGRSTQPLVAGVVVTIRAAPAAHGVAEVLDQAQPQRLVHVVGIGRRETQPTNHRSHQGKEAVHQGVPRGGIAGARCLDELLHLGEAGTSASPPPRTVRRLRWPS